MMVGSFGQTALARVPSSEGQGPTSPTRCKLFFLAKANLFLWALITHLCMQDAPAKPAPIRTHPKLPESKGLPNSRSSSMGTDSPFARSALGSEVELSGGEGSGSQSRAAGHKAAHGKPGKGIRRKAVTKSQELDPDWGHRSVSGRSGISR